MKKKKKHTLSLCVQRWRSIGTHKHSLTVSRCPIANSQTIVTVIERNQESNNNSKKKKKVILIIALYILVENKETRSPLRQSTLHVCSIIQKSFVSCKRLHRSPLHVCTLLSLYLSLCLKNRASDRHTTWTAALRSISRAMELSGLATICN